MIWMSFHKLFVQPCALPCKPTRPIRAHSNGCRELGQTTGQSPACFQSPPNPKSREINDITKYPQEGTRFLFLPFCCFQDSMNDDLLFNAKHLRPSLVHRSRISESSPPAFRNKTFFPPEFHIHRSDSMIVDVAQPRQLLAAAGVLSGPIGDCNCSHLQDLFIFIAKHNICFYYY